MADLERLSKALKVAHAAGNTEAAMKLATVIRQASAASPAPKLATADSSLGTAAEFGDLNSRANVAGYLGAANRRLEAGPVGTIMRAGDRIAAPIRSALGLENKTRDQVTDEYSEFQAAREENLRADAEALNYASMTSKDIEGVPSAIYYGMQKVAESASPMAASIGSFGTMSYLTSMGEAYSGIKDSDLTESEKVRNSTLTGAIMGVLENAGLGALFKGMPPGLLGKMGTKGVTDLLEKSGLGRFVSRVSSGFVTEGLTEVAQESILVGNEAIAGNEFEPGAVSDRLREAFIGGGAAGGTIKGTMSVAGGAADTVGNFMPKKAEADPDYDAAATMVARDLRDIAEAQSFDLKDVKTGGGAQNALNAAHDTILGEIKALSKEVAVRARLDQKQATSLDELIDDYAAAETAVRTGKNKVKSKTTQSNMDAIKRLLGENQESTMMVNLLKKSNVITDLFQDGFKGGVSQFTDFLNPITDNSGNYSPNRALASLGSAAGVAAVGPVKSAAIVAGGRAVDAVTGRRSKIARFVNNNEGNRGQATPTGESLIQNRIIAEQQVIDGKQSEVEEKAARRSALAATNLELAKRNAPPAGSPDNQDSQSPQYAVETALGLSRADVAKVLRVLEKTSRDPIIQSAIQGYRTSIATGGRFKDMTPLIRALKSKVQSNPGIIDSGAAGTVSLPQSPSAALQSAQEAAPTPNSENYNRGIKDNQDLNDSLAAAVKADPNVTDADRAKVLEALASLRKNLGKDVIARMKRIDQILDSVQGSVDPDVVIDYVLPYVDRIIDQQTRLADQERAAALPDFLKPTVREQRVVPVPFNNPKMQEMFGVDNPVPGGNYIDLDTKEDVTGTTYAGGSIKIVDGKPVMETSDTKAEPATKSDGVKVRVNLYKQKAGWKWIDYDGPSTLVSTTIRGKHFFSLETDLQNSVSLETYPNEPSEPRLRPTTQGEVQLGNIIGNISVQGKPRPVYDKVTVATPQAPKSGDSRSVPEMPAPRQFGGETDVSLETSLSNAFILAQTQMYAKGRDFKLDLQAKSLAAQEREGIDLNTLDDANIDRLADFAVEDALEALKDNENAIGWYNRTVAEALKSVGEIHPEVLTDPKAKMQFIWATAVTSNGLKVDKNFELALDVYESLKATGRFPTDAGIGTAAKAINSGLEKYHTMLEKFQRMSNSDEGAHRLLEEFMNGKFPLKQLQKEYGVKISGESANTEIRGSAILGPKIGGGFYANLYGNFDELTMDRWLMRTVGRWRGGLVKINKPMIVKKTQEIQSLLKTADLKALKPLFKKSGVFPRKQMSKDMVYLLSEVIAKESMDPAWRKAINVIPGGEDLRKKGNGLAGYLDGQVEMPAGPKERVFIRSVFTKALDRLQDTPEIRSISNEPLNMSDLQALLWYPEKRLYDTAKQKDGESRGYKDDEAPDYANAAKASVRNRLGSPGETGYGGGGPSATDAGPTVRSSIPFPGVLDRQQAGQRNAAIPRPIPEPTEVQVKQTVPRAKALFEIGKRGSRYEHGIRNLSEVKALAKGLGVTMKLYSTLTAMERDNPGLSGGSEAAYMEAGNLAIGLEPGALGRAGKPKTEFGTYISMLHEVSHAITSRSLDQGRRRLNTRAINPITGEPDFYADSSLEHVVLNVLKKNSTENRKILSELIYIQDKVELRDGQTGEGESVRTFAQHSSRMKEFKRRWARDGNKDFFLIFASNLASLKDQENYTRSLAEITVDPIILYLHDPKRMKQIAPATAKMVSDMFAKAGNPTIQLYNHPVAMALAVIMAGFAASMGAEEDEAMGSGALSPPPGALSA